MTRRHRTPGIAMKRFLLLLPPLLHAAPLQALPPGLPAAPVKSPLTQFVVPPQRIVWKSAAGVSHEDKLLHPRSGQAVLEDPVPPLVLAPGAGIVIDFGVEIAGSVELFTPMTKSKDTPPVRVRFGESVAETMAEIGERGAQNDHALRDLTVRVPWLGKTTVGPSGFRFVRIDNTDPRLELQLSQVRAILTLRDVPYLGSFRCSDPRLERIWSTGAYTVHLNMQDYLWDGIKRDRLVWLGDMHPEVSVINAVFGANEVVPTQPRHHPRRHPRHRLDERHQLLLDVVDPDPRGLVHASR